MYRQVKYIRFLFKTIYLCKDTSKKTVHAGNQKGSEKKKQAVLPSNNAKLLLKLYV